MIVRQIMTALMLMTASAPLLAVSGGKIGTLERGNYACEWPGDVARGFRVPAPEQDFTITSASGYTAAQGNGTYLRTGERIQMTSGPLKGTLFDVKNSRFLRRLDANGKPDRLRCILQDKQN